LSSVRETPYAASTSDRKIKRVVGDDTQSFNFRPEDRAQRYGQCTRRIFKFRGTLIMSRWSIKLYLVDCHPTSNCSNQTSYVAKGAYGEVSGLENLMGTIFNFLSEDSAQPVSQCRNLHLPVRGLSSAREPQSKSSTSAGGLSFTFEEAIYMLNV
jgi:hypothetical protein